MHGNFITFVKKENLFQITDRTLLAVSGGLDSVVMADLFFKAGYKFDIAHANFHLRGNESDRDELFVKNLAEKYKVKVFIKHFETARFARKNKISIQVAARQLRYEWFDELMSELGYDRVATAHHLDDQVETFLINLTRGTGIAGLHGILPLQGRIIRPMLFTGRKEIEAYALEYKLDFVEDSSNLSLKYTRNRIRHKIIPQLEKINPSFIQDLTRTIGFVREAETIYRQAVEQKRKEIFVKSGDQIFIPSEKFFRLIPFETWAYELLSPFGFNHSNVIDIAGLEDSIPGKEVHSATHRIIKNRDTLIIAPVEKTGLEKTFLITLDDLAHGSVKFPVHFGFEILNKIPAEFADPAIAAYIDMDRLHFPLIIRKWNRGDFFYPMGMSKRKKLSDFFIDLKFSKFDKENQWLLCSGNDIVWIISHRIDDRYKVTKDLKSLLKITFYPE